MLTKKLTPREIALNRIKAERTRQQHMWSLEHDDERSIDDWIFTLEYQIKKLKESKQERHQIQQLVQISAVALAGIEADIRKSKA